MSPQRYWTPHFAAVNAQQRLALKHGNHAPTKTHAGRPWEQSI